MPPTCYADILEAGLRRGRDFEVVIGNRENVRSCLIVAPHGGNIEPTTSEIARAVANVSSRSFYLFLGRLPRNNWDAFHIDSTSFDEPDFEILIADTELVVSFHGAQRDRGRNIYVGGRHAEGRELMIENLNPALQRFGIVVVDAARGKVAQSIAGLHPRNLTNRGRMGRGVQLEFSDAARLVFFPGRSRAERQRPNEHLTVLAQSVDAVLRRLTNFPVQEAMEQGIQ
jgi:phage replication-related protein YjqB (UPF0714/DUF867 family)